MIQLPCSLSKVVMGRVIYRLKYNAEESVKIRREDSFVNGFR